MSRFFNRTRRSASIPARLWRERRPYLVPVYFLLRASDLAREGIDHSGSAAFADHIYAGRPSGRFGIGWLLDAVILRLPPARAFRARYRFARQELEALIHERRHTQAAVEVLAVPCGLARELFDLAAARQAGATPPLALHGLDLDAGLIAGLQVRARALPEVRFSVGDALDPTSYRGPYDAVVSLGFVEFLDDAQVEEFFSLVRGQLKPGGRLVTSGLRREPISDYLLRQVGELFAHYRDGDDLCRLARAAGFAKTHTYRDRTGLLTMLVGEAG